MDTLTRYRQLIMDILREHAQEKPAYGEVEVELVLDESHDHYELSYVGWDDFRRIHGSVVHVDIRDGKIWVQHDGTEDGVATRLLEAGVPRDRIVLAFQHPDKRKLTEFAAA